MKKMFFCILFFFLLLVSTPGLSAPDLSTSDINTILKQATTLHDKAVANEGGWIITEKFIKKTKKLLAKDDKIKALEAANQARDYAKQSGKQAESEKINWSEPPYLK